MFQSLTVGGDDRTVWKTGACVGASEDFGEFSNNVPLAFLTIPLFSGFEPGLETPTNRDLDTLL